MLRRAPLPASSLLRVAARLAADCSRRQFTELSAPSGAAAAEQSPPATNDNGGKQGGVAACADWGFQWGQRAENTAETEPLAGGQAAPQHSPGPLRGGGAAVGMIEGGCGRHTRSHLVEQRGHTGLKRGVTGRLRPYSVKPAGSALVATSQRSGSVAGSGAG